MPALAFLAAVGMALVALLFVADATLEKGPPAIVTSERSGLPEPWLLPIQKVTGVVVLSTKTRRMFVGLGSR